jgi:hypothetical protein
MKKYSTCLILFAVLLLAACKKENKQQSLCDEPQINPNTCTTDYNQVRAQLPGRWTWTQTSGGWLPVVFTPCTDSVNRSYIFYNNGTVRYFENNMFISAGNYTLQQSSGLQLHATDSASTFVLNGEVSICDNYLLVDAQPVDGARVILVRQ